MSNRTALSLPSCVGVLGGGRMGSGIAHAFLLRGSHVLVVESDESAAHAARRRIEAAITKSIEKGEPGTADEISSRLKVVDDYSALADRQLVIEAVPENWDLKVGTLLKAEEHLSATGYLASNTSSLSVDGLASQLQRPQNFLGLHFFNPVPASTLIEVVIGKETKTELAESARRWVEGLGKTAVVVHDTPGFASSRLGVIIALEAMRMVEEGVASPEDIDNAMVLGYKHPTGPLRTTDIVGLDVRLGIAEYLQSTLGERFDPPQILRDLVARGDLGRKTGKGFFDWS